MLWSLLLLSSAIISVSVAQNCTSGDKLCTACIGPEPQAFVNRTLSLYTASFCNKLFVVQDQNTVNNTIDRCKQYFSQAYQLTVECQLPVFTDFNLTTLYTNAGLRSAAYTYFVGLVRGANCSNVWYYEAANGHRTASSNTSNVACDQTRAAFEGLQVKQVNPATYVTNSFACQCSAKMEDLPGSQNVTTAGGDKSGSLHFTSLSLLLSLTSALLHLK